jgi:hypothetical protein
MNSELRTSNNELRTRISADCTANKSEITYPFSMAYAFNSCGISAFRPKAFNSLEPFTSKSSILRLRKISKGATHGLSLEESQPQVATFRMFCNRLSHLLPYVAQPADATFETSITTLLRREPAVHGFCCLAMRGVESRSEQATPPLF